MSSVSSQQQPFYTTVTLDQLVQCGPGTVFVDGKEDVYVFYGLTEDKQSIRYHRLLPVGQEQPPTGYWHLPVNPCMEYIRVSRDAVAIMLGTLLAAAAAYMPYEPESEQLRFIEMLKRSCPDILIDGQEGEIDMLQVLRARHTKWGTVPPAASPMPPLNPADVRKATADMLKHP